MKEALNVFGWLVMFVLLNAHGTGWLLASAVKSISGHADFMVGWREVLP